MTSRKNSSLLSGASEGKVQVQRDNRNTGLSRRFVDFFPRCIENQVGQIRILYNSEYNLTYNMT